MPHNARSPEAQCMNWYGESICFIDLIYNRAYANILWASITSDYDSKHWSLLFLVFPVLTFWVIWKNIPIPNYPDIFQPVHPAVCTDPMWRLIQHSCTSSVCEESLVGSCTKKRSICQTEAVVYWSRPADGLWRHNGAFFGSLLPSWNVEPVGEWSLCVVLCITCHFHRRKTPPPLSNERKHFCKCNF